MKILNFGQITSEHKNLGGKAYNLGLLYTEGLNVPAGLVITSDALGAEDYDQIDQWWKSIGMPKLAVRSSASDEDDKGFSFAGQNSTYLNITNLKDLKSSIQKCFSSIDKHASQVYREHFLGKSEGHMNVVLQAMVDPKFAGVYFSQDPRGKTHGDLIEYSIGLAEDLVSGKITPYKIDINTTQKEWHPEWTSKYTRELKELGKKVKNSLGLEVDIEWAIDSNGELFLLQARPITAIYSHTNRKNIIEKELERINDSFASNTIWDGNTFSQWSSIPSYLSFSIMKESFAPEKSFSKALKTLGYLSFVDEVFSPHESIVDRIYGHVYINLTKMCPLYFGPIPYELDPNPRVHLKFNWKRIDIQTIVRTPLSLFNMIKVGWDLSSKRREWLDECSKELVKFNSVMNRPNDPNMYQTWDGKSLIDRFSKEVFIYTNHTQHWPLVLVILVESTIHSLEAILKSVTGEKEAKELINTWMAKGLRTATYQMNRSFQKACLDQNSQDFFMSRYGHRGAGELDLKNPRWAELGPKAFYKIDKESQSAEKEENDFNIEEEVEKLQTFKKTIIIQQWNLLKDMLELREKWKMASLRPFSHIRYIAKELGSRAKIGSDIFELSHQEILKYSVGHDHSFKDEYEKIIAQRNEENQIYKLYSLPTIVNHQTLEEVIKGNYDDDSTSLKGEALSPGLTFGTIKIISDASEVDLESLPNDLIVVAETTDPGWTPIFTKAKGIIVEKGGILSHSAIVAREMGIPAISGIRNSLHKFKDGQRIRLDGNNGHISYE